MSALSLKIAKLGGFFGVVAAVHASHSDIETIFLVGGFISAVLVWVALQVRDYKPNKRLRQDNGELRAQNDDLRRLLDESETKQRDLEKSRDFDTSFAGLMASVTEGRAQAAAEHRAILEEIAESRQNQREAWATFHQQLASLTSAIQVVASGILSESTSPATKGT